jgi:pimeloyl-ACP methyl ester carboxylesterase
MTGLDLLHLAVRASLVRGGAEFHPAQLGGRRASYYLLRGDDPGAPPAVLVHGLGGQANSFARILRRLRPGFSRIYAVDLPGHGFAAFEDGEPPIEDMELFAALHEFCRKIAGEPAVLVGNSLGGALCLIMGAMAPALVRGLALISPAGAPFGPGEFEALRDRFQPGARAGIALVRRMFYRPPPGLLLFGRSLARHFSSPAVHQILASYAHGVHVPADALARLSMPVLLVWGAHEAMLPYAGLDHFRRHLPPHARIVVMEAASHVAMLERPRETARLVLELAAEVRRVSTARSAT